MQSSERNTFILLPSDTKMAINFAPEVSFVPIKVQDVNKTR